MLKIFILLILTPQDNFHNISLQDISHWCLEGIYVSKTRKMSPTHIWLLYSRHKECLQGKNYAFNTPKDCLQDNFCRCVKMSSRRNVNLYMDSPYIIVSKTNKMYSTHLSIAVFKAQKMPSRQQTCSPNILIPQVFHIWTEVMQTEIRS